jgi:hypothetical protein
MTISGWFTRWRRLEPQRSLVAAFGTFIIDITIWWWVIGKFFALNIRMFFTEARAHRAIVRKSAGDTPGPGHLLRNNQIISVIANRRDTEHHEQFAGPARIRQRTGNDESGGDRGDVEPVDPTRRLCQ